MVRKITPASVGLRPWERRGLGTYAVPSRMHGWFGTCLVEALCHALTGQPRFSPICSCFVPTNQHPLLPRFKGVCLSAPAIQGNPPPKLVVTLLRYLVAPVIPTKQIPDALESGELGLSRRVVLVYLPALLVVVARPSRVGCFLSLLLLPAAVLLVAAVRTHVGICRIFLRN